MANTFSPFGFRQFGRQEGGSPTAGLTAFTMNSSYASAVFTGDLVSLSSAAGSANSGNLVLTDESSGRLVQGVFLGCEYYNPSVNRITFSAYFPGSVGSSSPVTAYVCTDPEQLYIAQASTTSGVVGSSLIGFNISFCSSQQTSGNTLSGISAVSLASSAVSQTDPSLPFRVVNTYAAFAPPGVNGTSTGSEGAAILVVAPNNFARKSLTPASS